jgi:acyl-CoA thioester hydrolase
VARLSLEPSRDPATYSFTHRLRTRFAETDAMGVIHHAAYLPYLEEARVEYLRAIGHPYDAVRSREGGDAREFPVLEVSVQYRQALHFDDEVDVSLRIGAVRGATFQIAYLLAVAGEARATAVTVHGCTGASGRPARLPAWVRDSVEAGAAPEPGMSHAPRPNRAGR